MLSYTVYYKPIGLLSIWKKIKNVKGDGIMQEHASRYFILENETRLEVPMNRIVFKFSKERFFSIKERLELNAGQDVKINKR